MKFNRRFRLRTTGKGPNILQIVGSIIDSIDFGRFLRLLFFTIGSSPWPPTWPPSWPPSWPAEGWLAAIVTSWSDVGIRTSRATSWPATALLPLHPVVPVGANQGGAVAGGAAPVRAGARLGRLRCQGSVRAAARRSQPVGAHGASGQGGGNQEREEEKVEHPVDLLERSTFGWRVWWREPSRRLYRGVEPEATGCHKGVLRRQLLEYVLCK